MEFWEYQDQNDWNEDFINKLNLICEKYNPTIEFNLLIPEKFRKFIEEISNIETNILYNIKFINTDIEYIIIEDIDVIKINDISEVEIFILYSGTYKNINDYLNNYNKHITILRKNYKKFISNFSNNIFNGSNTSNPKYFSDIPRDELNNWLNKYKI